MIDLDMMPPDWKFAQEHAKANKPGLVDDILSPNSSNIFCPCCFKPIIKKDVPLLNNSKQLEFMGFGFPLYFIFIKYCIILLLILICSYSAISLYWGVSNSRSLCEKRLLVESPTSCTSVFVKWARIEPQVQDDEILMRITSFVIHMLTLLYIRDNISKTMKYYNQRTTSLSDFSLILRNLPLKEGIQKNIRDFIYIHFEQKWKFLRQNHSGQEFESMEKVVQVTLLPQIEDYYKVLHQKSEIIKEKRYLLKQRDSVPQSSRTSDELSQSKSLQKSELLKSKIMNSNQQLNLIGENISQISTRYRQLAKQDLLKSSIAIVTLSSQIFQSVLLEFGSQNKLDSRLLGQYFGDFEGEIQIKIVPKPNQIVWRNANYTREKFICSKIVGWLLSAGFIAIVTVGFYFILLIKTKYLLAAIEQKQEIGAQSTTHYQLAVALVFIDIFLIVLFNKLVMGSVLHYFNHHELHFSTSNQQFSFALKYTLGLFFTTALMTLAVEAVTFQNFYAHQFGVVQEESIMFIINAFLIPIIWLINPWQIVTLIKRKLRENKPYFTQRQANELMSDTPYTIGKRYAQIVEIMWFTYLYATLIPVGAFFTTGSIRDLAVVSLKLLDFTLILRPIGQLIFDSQVRDNVEIESIILVFFGAVYLILPLNKILQFFHRQDFNPEEKSYHEVKDMFLQTYQTMHPILSFKALKILDNLKKISTKQISLNRIEITESHLYQSPRKDNSFNSLDFQSMKSNKKLNQQQFYMKSHRDPLQDRDAQHQQLQYESRKIVKKSASKNYFAQSRKKEDLPLFQFK